jgi:FtsH-binding integral membrane protein
LIEFLRKVYGIVATQLCFVALVSAVMISLENVKMFFQNNPGFLLLIFLATMVSLLAVYAKRLEYPTNFYLLGVFTFFESLSIGTLVSFFDKMLVIQAIILTAVIVIGLTIYTFQTKRDFSAMGAGLFAFLCVLLAGGIIQVRKMIWFEI